METVVQITMLCLVGCVLALLLKKSVPELQLLLVVAVAAVAFIPAAAAAKEAMELFRLLAERSEIDAAYWSPVVKCAGIAIVTRLGGDLCRDAGQSALASLIEIAGVFSAVALSAPLLRTVLDALLKTL